MYSEKNSVCFVHKNRPNEFFHMDWIFTYLFTVAAVTIWVPTVRGKFSFPRKFFVLCVFQRNTGDRNMAEQSLKVTL